MPAKRSLGRTPRAPSVGERYPKDFQTPQASSTHRNNNLLNVNPESLNLVPDESMPVRLHKRLAGAG